MLARKSLLTVLTNVVGAALGVVGLLAIGRFMGPDPLGAFFYALGLVGLVVFLSRLGFDSAHMKRVAEGPDLAAKIGTYSAIKVVLTAAFALFAILAVLVWERLGGFFSTSSTVLLVVVGYYVAMSLRGIPEYTFTGLRLTASLQVMVFIEHIVKFPVLVAGALVYARLKGHWVPVPRLVDGTIDLLHLSGPATVAFGAALIALAWGLSMLASAVGGFVQMGRLGLRAGRYDRELARSYTRFAMPIAVLAAMTVIAAQLDTVMIGFFWSETDVGYYGAALRITTLVMIIPLALKAVFFPTASGFVAQGQSIALRATANDVQRYMSLVMMLATMFLLLYAEEGLHIFMSDSFVPAAPVLRYMALATLMIGFMQVTTGILMAYEAPRTVAAIGIAAMGVNLTLNTLFIPDSFLGVPMLGLRAPGAALATFLAYTVLVVQSHVAVRKKAGWHMAYGRPLKHAVAAALTALALHLLHGTPLLDHVDRWWEIGIAGGIGTALYLLLLLALREVTRKDLDFVLDLLHPRKMGTYVRDELAPRKAP